MLFAGLYGTRGLSFVALAFGCLNAVGSATCFTLPRPGGAPVQRPPEPEPALP